MSSTESTAQMERTDRVLGGWASGFIGVAIFSGSLPATRVAVLDLNPLFLTFARAAIAGCCALVLLLVLKQRPPRRGDLVPLVITALGVVLDFPLLTALALRHMTAAHSIVYIGLLPLATAAFGVLRAGERPKPLFWLFAGIGSAAIAAYALRSGAGGSYLGDGLMLAAIVVCGLGYAEGASLSRRLGSWQVICWALVISLPFMLALAFAEWPDWSRVGAPAIAALAYVGLFSMLVGFFFWYRGLALGGIAAVGQLQLLQPFLGLMLAAGILGEPVGWDLVLASLVVVACVAATKRFAR